MTTTLIRDRQQSLAASLKAQQPRRRVFKRWPWIASAFLTALGLPFVLWPTHQAAEVDGDLPGIRSVASAAPLQSATCPDDTAPLQRELSAIARSFDGTVGIAVQKVGCSWAVGERLDEYFPQQSVSKLWVSLAIMDAVDAGKLDLDKRLMIRPQDLTLFHQPTRHTVLESGYVDRSIAALMSDALAHSDNTANDRLLWSVGGPDRIRSVLAKRGLKGIKFGPGERLLQSGIAGLEWHPSYSLGRNFEQARARLPQDLRHSALSAYLSDPIDGATPAGIARGLAMLAQGQLLSPQSTAVMMDILSRTRSGPRRLKAGAPAQWTVFHKTGTGQDLGRTSTGYNDVGILEAPDGTRFSVAVMISQTTAPIPARMEMMQQVTAAIARFHEGGTGSLGEATGKFH